MRLIGEVNNKKIGYSPGLKGLLNLSESNYQSLKRLIPGMSVRNEQEFLTGYKYQNLPVTLKFQVTERCKYTTTLEVFETSPILNLLPCTRLTVRMYHDAEVAEVLANSKKLTLHGNYSYPNAKMLQVDEKTQCNLFLEQWLAQCIQYGLVKKAGMAEGRVNGGC